ncbi:Rcs stress response system protein RcsF [Pseudidiomarina gelatinasegens]|jgi:hypothetical protein|uniref:Rcs stress response system protein RcsF n=1 Tax=Pseudidiomarina gelatinasegens TaxID=2487740 RepID=UPI003A96C6C9
MKYLLWALSVLVLSGCAGSAQQSNFDLGAADTVEFMRPYELSRNDVSFVSLGEVQGASCQARFFNEKPTQEEALLRMKIAAADLGANRVVLRSCTQGSSDECSARWVCVGDAYQEQPLR